MGGAGGGKKLAGGFFKQEMGTGMDFSAQAGRGGL